MCCHQLPIRLSDTTSNGQLPPTDIYTNMDTDTHTHRVTYANT